MKWRDKSVFVKVFREGTLAEIDLSDIQASCWSAIKLYLRPRSVFFYMRGKVLSDVLMKERGRSISAARCSAAMADLEGMGFIKRVEGNVYMVNYLYAFNGSREMTLSEAEGLDVFGDGMKEFLRRSYFVYDLECLVCINHLKKSVDMDVASDRERRWLERVSSDVARDAKAELEGRGRFAGLGERPIRSWKI